MLFLFKFGLIDCCFFIVSPEKMEEIQERINAEREKLKKQKNLKEAERDKLSAQLEKREKKVKKAL